MPTPKSEFDGLHPCDFYEPDEEKTTIVSPQNEIGADNRITYSGEGCKNL
jgi:hypothetical protein